MLNGLLNLPWWGNVLAALALTHVTIAAVTIFLHRHQAHRALELQPVISHFFRFWLWLTTGMKTKEWVAVHRKHHAKCETIDDPHSPQVLGINKVLWQGTELYRHESSNAETIATYGKGTPDDWIERNVYERFSYVGVVLMLLVDLVLFGVVGITIWAVQIIWIPFWAAGVINGIGHYWGYRNYECQSAATNIAPWGVIVGGEEFHNNHHAFPSSAKLSSKWWEFDIGWMYIRLMTIARLAWVRKVAPIPIIGPIKPIADIDTLQAVLTNRFRVMSRYYQDVLLPVLREELQSAQSSHRQLLKHARKLLVREECLLKDEAKHKLATVLNLSRELKIVYSYKQRLQELWKGSSGGQESPLDALQEWCKQAETAGIQVLQDFARNLRGYTLQIA